MSSQASAAPDAALPSLSARAEASRRNGAKSRGPKTPEGKARSSQNALKHGLRAQKLVVLRHEDAAGYEAHEEALLAELAPEGPLQTLLARRVAAAAWRLERADRMEAELFEQQGRGDRDLGLAMIRDCNGARAFPTLLRYRGAALAEFWRALKALKALQAEAEALSPVRAAEPAPAPTLEPRPARIAPHEDPDEPERCQTRGGTEPAPLGAGPVAPPAGRSARPALRPEPDEPEREADRAFFRPAPGVGAATPLAGAALPGIVRAGSPGGGSA
jgi:hypothetical protein